MEKKGIVIRNNKYAYNLQGKNHEKILHRIIFFFIGNSALIINLNFS